MGLFSKTPKSNPKIFTQGIEVEFHQDDEWWSFTYRGTNYSSSGRSLTLPSLVEQDSMLNALESLKPELKSRLEKGLCEWSDARPDDGETYSVDVKEFATEKTFTVSWSGGASWGDICPRG